MDPAVPDAILALLQRLRPAGLRSDRRLRRIAAAIATDFARAFSAPSPAPPAPGPPLSAAVAEYLLHKEAEGCRPATHRAYRLVLHRFAVRAGDRSLAGLTAAAAAFLHRIPHPVSRRSAWIVLHRFFRWAVTMNHLAAQPLAFADRPRHVVPNAGVVYTPAEARAILARTMATDEIGFWALALFSGLRTEEIKRLQRHPAPWTLVRPDPGVIEVPPAMAKRRPRLIPILPVLRAWLDWIRRHRFPFFPPRDRLRLARTRRAVLAPGRARLPPAARQNMARRSYISYRLGLPGSSYAAVAAAAGNTEATIAKYYRRTVAPADAAAYFSLDPAACAPCPPTPPPLRSPT